MTIDFDHLTASFRHFAQTRCRDDRGEGVISAAIAVLIMAFLGSLMWVGFQRMWTSTEANTNRHLEQMNEE